MRRFWPGVAGSCCPRSTGAPTCGPRLSWRMLTRWPGQGYLDAYEHAMAWSKG